MQDTSPIDSKFSLVSSVGLKNGRSRDDSTAFHGFSWHFMSRSADIKEPKVKIKLFKTGCFFFFFVCNVYNI